GARTAVVSRGVVNVFDTTSKTLLRKIPLTGGGDDVPSDKVVTNGPVRLLYLEDIIHVVGFDVPSFASVWSCKDSGARHGALTTNGQPDVESVDVYRGGVSIIDGGHVAVADTALRRLVLIDSAGERTTIVRQVSQAPCSEQDLTDAFIGDDTQRA